MGKTKLINVANYKLFNIALFLVDENICKKHNEIYKKMNSYNKAWMLVTNSYYQFEDEIISQFADEIKEWKFEDIYQRMFNKYMNCGKSYIEGLNLNDAKPFTKRENMYLEAIAHYLTPLSTYYFI